MLAIQVMLKSQHTLKALRLCYGVRGMRHTQGSPSGRDIETVTWACKCWTNKTFSLVVGIWSMSGVNMSQCLHNMTTRYQSIAQLQDALKFLAVAQRIGRQIRKTPSRTSYFSRFPKWIAFLASHIIKWQLQREDVFNILVLAACATTVWSSKFLR